MLPTDPSATLEVASSQRSIVQKEEMTSASQPDKTPNKIVRGLQHIYHPLGFRKGYNFTLCESHSKWC